MIRHSILAAVATVGLGLSPVLAQCVTNDRVALNQDETNSPADFEALKAQVKARFGLDYGLTCDGKTLFAEQEPVNVPSTDVSFPKQLSLAYERAMLRIQAKQVMTLYGTQTSQKVLSLMQDDSTNSRQWGDLPKQLDASSGNISKVDAVLDKALDLMGAKIDSELEKLGVPADQARRSSVAEKKLLFKNNFRKEIVRKGVGDIRGIVPVATHIFTVTRGGKQSVQLGVIAIESNNTRQFATDIAKKRPSTIRGTPNSLAKILPSKNEEYLDEIGLRFVYDETGEPMLISYGRWSVTNKADNPARFEQYVIQAKETALNLAQSYINEFASSSYVVEDRDVIESISETIAERVSEFENKKLIGQDELTREVEEVISKRFAEFKAKSQIQLRGMGELRKWEAEDPNTKILNVGAVAVWSAKVLANQNEMVRQNNGVPQKAPSAPAASSAGPDNRVSKPVNKASDF